MKKHVMILCVAALLIALTPLIYQPKSFKAETNQQRIQCITQFGWEIESEPIEQETMIIPNPLDAVYEEYNKFQKEIGLDLVPYAGRESTRYTYVVTNHPEANGRQVRANILVCDNKVIAGDIMVTAIDGFMHALNKK